MAARIVTWYRISAVRPTQCARSRSPETSSIHMVCEVTIFAVIYRMRWMRACAKGGMLSSVTQTDLLTRRTLSSTQRTARHGITGGIVTLSLQLRRGVHPKKEAFAQNFHTSMPVVEAPRNRKLQLRQGMRRLRLITPLDSRCLENMQCVPERICFCVFIT
jgi:hypothetical protein